MPIPPFQHRSHDEEHGEHNEPALWIKVAKWVVVLGAVTGITMFFIRSDKQKLYERIFTFSEAAERFDVWTSRSADAIVSFFAD
jgi:hypothetical protein